MLVQYLLISALFCRNSTPRRHTAHSSHRMFKHQHVHRNTQARRSAGAHSSSIHGACATKAMRTIRRTTAHIANAAPALAAPTSTRRPTPVRPLPASSALVLTPALDEAVGLVVYALQCMDCSTILQ
ncbi:hypothetical protein [Streptomyces sp900105755]|uniref:Secreted protein n=1 Tax=Streptomyces sp. 900105755 TaxID=3154389 RepID=A0ABV1TR00_9ACTN